MAADPPNPGMLDGIVNAIEKGFLGHSDTAAGAIASSAYKQASDLMDIHEEMVSAFGENSDTFKKMYAGITEVQTNFYGMAAESGEALNTIFKNQGELIGEYQGIISSNLLQIHATTKEVTAKEMADLTLYGRALNFGSNQTQKFLERQFALTGEVNNELLKQTLAYSNAIEDSTGISSKIIAGNISGMMSDVKTFGNMTVEEMSEAAAAIAKVGLEVSDVAGLVGKFSTFESAAESVSKLTQVFGVQMDTMKYMTASFESPEEMLAMIQEDFETAGVDMANMNMAQKRLLSQTLGMDITSVESLLGEAGSDLSQFTDQVSGATAGVGASDIDSALANAGDDIARLNEMGDTIGEGLANTARKTKEAIGAVFSSGIRDLADEATLLAGEIPRSASILTRIAGEGAEDLAGVRAIKESLEEGTIVIRESLKSANDINEDAANAGSGNLVSATLVIGESLVGAIIGELEKGATAQPESLSGQSSPATPALERKDREAISEGIESNTERNLAVVEVDTSMNEKQIRALLAEINDATGGGLKESIADMTSQIIKAQQAAADSRESRPINITIKDTGPGFEWKLDQAGAVTVGK